MQAKHCLLFAMVLLIGSIAFSSGGFVPLGKVGKRQVQ